VQDCGVASEARNFCRCSNYEEARHNHLDKQDEPRHRVYEACNEHTQDRSEFVMLGECVVPVRNADRVSKQAYRVVVLSFEGPDPYSFVGGLGVRVDEAAPVEQVAPNLELRRWSQWISALHSGGVYEGEEGKVADYARSVPPFIVDEVVAPAAERGERVLVLAEDWQTAEAVIHLDRMLRARGLRHAATILWNANNTYGFERINMHALAAACTITAVSKYMKFELATVGVPALVVPNGIPTRLLDGPKQSDVDALREAVGTDTPFYAKVGRYSPDKAWFQAIDAMAALRAEGVNARLVVRGGKEAYGEEVFARARRAGLRVVEVRSAGRSLQDICTALSAADGDIIDLRAYLEQPLLYALYAAADAVLANSKKEPFGLVGLEVMAAGGVPVCGSTGEEYAEPSSNAIVVDTDDGVELATALAALARDPAYASRIRRAGHTTAERYTWPSIIRTLEEKLPFIEYSQHRS
jgi:glycosyltransferase involved in cell wall biosynthesis